MVTWNNKPSVGGTASDIKGNFPQNQYTEWDVKVIVEAMRAGTAYGIAVKHVTENFTYGNTGWIDFVAKENGFNPEYRPKLTIVYNTPPGKPSYLSPGGIQAVPARLTTLIPILSWSHNDPDGDEQAGFQVVIHRANDNAVVCDSGNITSALSRYTVPADTLVDGTLYYWQVRTRDAGGLWSEYSNPVYVYTNRAPYGPTNLTPGSNSVFDATQPRLLGWTFQDGDTPFTGDSQTAYHLQIKRVSDGVTVYNTNKVTSSLQQHILPANTLLNGVSYQWQVKTWDDLNTEGPYSSLAAFRTGRPPSVSVVSPYETYNRGQLTVEWSYVDPENDPQVLYRAILRNALGDAIEDSGEVISSANQHAFAANLDNQTEYSVTVTVEDATGQTSTDTNVFVTDFTPAPMPAIVVLAEDTHVFIRITNPQPGQGEEATIYNHLLRRKAGETQWTRIAKEMPLNATYSDYNVQSGAEYQYRAVAVAASLGIANSPVYTAEIKLRGTYLHPVSSPAEIIRIRVDDRSTPITYDRVQKNYEGRKLPVSEFSERRDVSIPIRAFARTRAERDAIVAMLDRREVLCYRDYLGEKEFVTVAGHTPRVLRDGIGIYEIILTLDAVDHHEAK